MEFLNKIETLINSLLEKLGAWFISTSLKIIPPKVQNFYSKIKGYIQFAIVNFKNLPNLTKAWIQKLIQYIKSQLQSYEYKAKIKEIIEALKAKYKEQQSDGPKKFSKVKNFILTPFLLVSEWMKGLTTSQILLLLGFSGASVLAGINMIFSSQRLLHRTILRSPASIEEEIPYDRPDYYKLDAKHMSITNFRLPVYVADVNELRSVDIDFIATMSNRNIKRFLEINEFQLRDHFITHFEPLIASFPLEEEGKEVIREKLHLEINEFLKLYNQEGEVTELKITYILAN